jgi:hypothetical protein
MNSTHRKQLEMKMRMPMKILAAAAFAAAVPLAGLASAQTIGVQYGGYYGDGYYAYGAAPGGYYAYGAAPGYRYAPRYRQWNFGNGSYATAPGSSPRCPADLEPGSAYPSWMCR